MLVSVLISRQSLTICCNTLWIQQTLAACKKIFENNDILLTSVGQNTWNFQLFCGTTLGLNLRIVVPASDRDEFKRISDYYKEQFKFDENKVGFIYLESKANEKNNTIRDQYIIDNSELIYPISLRNNGFFQNSLKACKKINATFQIKYEAHSEEKRKKIYRNFNNEKFNKFENYLFHWTRKPKENWPDETQLDYYMSIIEKEGSPRTAFDTLCHILDKNIIYSSSRHALKNCKSVSFTGSPIDHFFGLMKWRNKYNEMSYEPYGIGIDREEALKRGFKKVLYCDLNEYKKLTVEEKKINHTSGIKTNWSEEQEYRYFGDLDMKQIPNEKKICICQNSDESIYVEKKYVIKTYSLY